MQGRYSAKGPKIRELALLVRHVVACTGILRFAWHKAIDIRCLVEALGGDTARLIEANLEDGETRRISNG
jgi:hypothetical protein